MLKLKLKETVVCFVQWVFLVTETGFSVMGSEHDVFSLLHLAVAERWDAFEAEQGSTLALESDLGLNPGVPAP